ncbi:DNA internalization-related competence protein ComEC/Rec2 [Paenibacillus tarimensis]
MANRPLIWFTVCWITGNAAAAGLQSRGVLIAGAGLAAIAFALVLLRQASWRLAAACLAAYGFAAGERAWADARNVTALPDLLAAAEAGGPTSAFSVQMSGTIVSAVTIDGDRVQLRVTADSVRVTGEQAPREVRERLQIQVRLAAQPEQAVAAGWKRGDRISAAGELTLPAGATNFGGFDYRRYLHSQRIHWLLRIDGAAAVETGPGPEWTAAALLGRVDDARQALGARIDRLYPERHAGFMKGLVLGNREDIDPAQFRQFSNLGLTHILAISGLHVGVFLLCLHTLLRLFRLTRESSISIMLAAVPLYVLLSGAAPSVVRAGLMAMIGLWAAKRGVLKDGLHLLAAAALLMLAVQPFLLHNISFQLSFIVTAGLIIGVPPVRGALPGLRRGKFILDGLSVALVAQLISFPLTIYYFNQFHLLSLPANLILVPLISSVVLPLGAASLILSLLWTTPAGWVSAAARLVNEGAFAVVDLMNETRLLRTFWPSPPIWWIVLWYALLLLAFNWLNRFKSQELPVKAISDETRPLYPSAAPATVPLGGTAVSNDRREENASLLGPGLWRPAALLISAILLLTYAYTPDRFNRSASVAMLDVGQGDALLVRTPEGRHILIDGGGTVRFRKPGEEWRERKDPFEVGRKVVVPLLLKRGVQQIDLLVLSHLDTDHIGGLQAVLETIPVRKILWNGTLRESDSALQLLRTAVQLKIPVYAACPGQSWEMERDVSMTVLWPDNEAGKAACDLKREGLQSGIETVNEQNEISVVLLLELYGRKLLLTGDIGIPAERKLLGGMTTHAGGVIAPGQIDLLKIAHHGSRNSSTEEWLHYWRPGSALISVGRYNVYGHPHPTVTGRLEEMGVQIYRTDRDGEVQFRITRKGIEKRMAIQTK